MSFVKTHSKVLVTLLVVLMLIMSAVGLVFISVTPTYAASGHASITSFPVPGEVHTAHWGVPSNMNFLNGWRESAGNNDTVIVMTESGVFGPGQDGKGVFCIEPGAALSSYGSTVAINLHDESLWSGGSYNRSNGVLTNEQMVQLIGTVMGDSVTGEGGYRNTDAEPRLWVTNDSTSADFWQGEANYTHYKATQLLIWEIVVGERDAHFNHIDTGGRNRILDVVSPQHPLHDGIMARYNTMEAYVKTALTVPSFANGSETTLKWDGSAYSATLTDTNGVLKNYNCTCADRGVACSVQGNNLVLTSDHYISSPVQVTTTSKLNRQSVLTYTDMRVAIRPGGGDGYGGDTQDVVTYDGDIPLGISGMVPIKTDEPFGYVAVEKKVPAGYSPAGAEYAVYGSRADAQSDVSRLGTLTLNEEGRSSALRVRLNNDGTKTVYVKEVGTPYQSDDSFEWEMDTEIHEATLVVTNTEVNPVMVKSENHVNEKGWLSVRKNTPDLLRYSPEGAQYTVYSNEACTTPYLLHGSRVVFTMKADGTTDPVQFDHVNGGLTVYLKETRRPDLRRDNFEWVMDPKVYSATITKNNTREVPCMVVSKNEITPYGYLTLYKSSSDPRVSEGNGLYTLAGAVYTVYGSYDDAQSNSNPLGTFITDARGDTNTLKLEGLKTYYYKETKRPPGFSIDDTIYSVYVPQGDDVQLSKAPVLVSVEDQPRNDPLGIQLHKKQKNG